MAKSNKQSIKWNLGGIALGVLALFWMVDILVENYRYGSGAYFFAFAIGLVAVFFIIYNVRAIRKKRGAAGTNKTKSKPATSRPRPRPGSTADADESFIAEIQDGRCYDTFAYDRLGVAELFVDVEYEDGVYYLKPEIEVTYDSDTVKTQSDVDAYDDVVVDAYQQEFNEMIRICEAWGVDYDIAEPEVTTNIKNGRIV